ncbi:MAG: tetratricopeptide repeat protein [Phycisphaerae bacterium]|nr:tetratricopeptide repeat protein [Phycisphaerae bacterium]
MNSSGETPNQAGRSNPSAASGAASRLERLQALVAAEPNDTFCLYGLAQEYAQRGQHDEAIRWYDRCLAVDPNYCYAYYHKAKALEAAGRAGDAVRVLQTGLERARSSGDRQAVSEIGAYLDELDA